MGIFELIAEEPIWILGLIFMIVFTIAPIFKMKKKALVGSNGAKIVDLGDKDEIVEPYGYYYYQEDNQVVIKRSPQQQRIVDEYFIVRNYKKTTGKSLYKKLSEYMSMFASMLLADGLIIAVINFITEEYDFEVALENTWFVVGLVVAALGIVAKIVSGHFKKKYEESIRVTVAPEKLMTDAEYEALVDEKIAAMDIGALGLEKLGLDPDQVAEINPIVIRDKVINQRSLTVRNKENHSVHSSTQHVTYLYFTDEQLFVYKIQFDMCCNAQDEWASEYFYKDICDVSSHTSRNVLKTDNFEFEYSTVSFNIIATNSQIGFDLAGDNENIASIQAMKQKIREKKQSS